MRTPHSFIAHCRQDAKGNWIEHLVDEHLQGTAALASAFAAVFGSADWAQPAGQWHDLGKYRRKFQHYIRNQTGYDSEAHIESENPKKGTVNHSAAGALYAFNRLGPAGRILAYLIAGHHAGLPDFDKIDAPGRALREILADSQYLDDLPMAQIPDEILVQPAPTSRPIGGRDGYALWIRMLFSCLVDADFLDTEAFMDPAKYRRRGSNTTIAELLSQFDRHMRSLSAGAGDTPVNRIRADVLEHCRQAAKQPPGRFSLTVPTGGGKTLSSMAFALEHAARHNKRRIIYTIPYTSIVEQTSEVFQSIFADGVIEHHCNLDPDQEDSRSRLATENWDAPIIVTTNVQLLESLFASRSSRCRKLHNIADSIIILDEAQLLPPNLLQPILNTLRLLTDHYGVTLVLCTATQPALTTYRDAFGNAVITGLEPIREIIPDCRALNRSLERVQVELPTDFHQRRSWSDIANELQQYPSVLAVVNTRNDARELHRLLPADTLHLSALMCGQHRSKVIKEIKARLNEREPVRVVSTQLVEAGVDIDFPVLYRALAGLDSIAQAAGRCNREGKLPQPGRVVVFVPPQPAPPGHLRRAESVTLSLLDPDDDKPLSPERFTPYFQHLYGRAPSLDQHGISELLRPDNNGGVQLRTAAIKFKLIDDSRQQTVLVKYDDHAELLINTLRKTGPDRYLMRKLQRYAVTVSRYRFDALLKQGDVAEIWQGIYTQATPGLYHPVLGLNIGDDPLLSADLVI
jgi:CRISPR-associated endonuclease/helicase Cas3